ncbi:piggyBac transposable element-derived protein 4-like [Palaemon carinicauda]|uniref:piggyBac transposable element-derived protein 4-like n=1 Tax=Palaemon carinicauda TaxID=392227 RepID=UPI0035B5A330
MGLMDPYLNKGRNVTTDNYFTAVNLAKQLKIKVTIIIGTMNKIRREVPATVRTMKDNLYSTKLYKSGDMTLTVYQGKLKKNVVVFSTFHQDVSLENNAKKTPETIKFYNETKYRGNILDQMAQKYSVRTCTRRWPIHSFQITLDLAAINAWVIYKEETKEKIAGKEFLVELSEELANINI